MLAELELCSPSLLLSTARGDAGGVEAGETEGGDFEGTKEWGEALCTSGSPSVKAAASVDWGLDGLSVDRGDKS